MNKRKPLARTATVALVAASLGGVATVASAQTAPISATIGDTAISGRAIVGVTPATLLAVDPTTATGATEVAITETLVTSDGNWSATLDVDTLASGANSLALTNLTATPNTPTNPTTYTGVVETFPVAASGGTAGSAGTLDSTVTLFDVAQTAGNVYSGIYVSNTDLSLSIPDGTAAGTYTGTMTVTIVN